MKKCCHLFLALRSLRLERAKRTGVNQIFAFHVSRLPMLCRTETDNQVKFMLRELAKIPPWFMQINCIALATDKSQEKWFKFYPDVL